MPWSYTMLSTYKQCPAKYKYRYVEKIRTPQSAAAARGTAKHAAIEAVLKGEAPTLTDPGLSFYNTYVQRLKTAGAKAELKLEIDADWNVAKEGDRPWGIAYIDSVVFGVPTTSVQDWKSGKIYDDHQEQKEIYSAMLLPYVQAECVQISFAHVYTDLKKERSVTFHRSQLLGIQKVITGKVSTMVGDKELVPTPYWGCRWCDYSKTKGGPCRF